MNGSGRDHMQIILCAVAVFAMCAAAAPLASASESSGGPWPADVPGWVKPESGEHPRLFFRKADVPALRRRAETPAGKAIIERLRRLLDGADGTSMPKVKSNITTAYGKKGGPRPAKTEFPEGTYSMSHAAGYGLLYTLTGDGKYADLGRESFEWAFQGVRDRDREGRYSFRQPGGALRAGPSLGWYAVGYDLCYNGWDDDFREKVAGAIANYNEGKHCSLAELVKGKRHMPGSNHWGMQVGGGALAILAVRGDRGADDRKIEGLLGESRKCMVRNMTQGFGDHGWFAEGDGTGSMSSHIVFCSALNAWKVAGGKDFISPRPNAPWMTLKWIFLTIPRNGQMDFPKRGAYPHNIWQREGLSGAGYFAQGFGAVTEAQAAGMLWFYNTHLKAADQKRGTPLDTISHYPHNSVMSFINWPYDLEPRNPADVIPRAVRDEKYGFYMFRNRWKDENDIVVSVQTKSTRGWHRAKTDGSIAVWGMGRKTNWGRIKSNVTTFTPAADGSAVLSCSDGTCLAVDFSGASGAQGMLAMTGPGAGGGKSVRLGDRTVSFLFLGRSPTPKPEGDAIVVGEQTVRFEDGRLVLAKMAGPWAGPGELGTVAHKKTPAPPGTSPRSTGGRRVVANRTSGRPSAAVVASWDDRLLAEVRAAVAAGRRPAFRFSLLRRTVAVSGADDAGRIALSASGMRMEYHVSRLKIEDRKSLAVALTRGGSKEAAALAAFYLTATGRAAEARVHLSRAGDRAAQVREAFE